jgi:hypothetical protein
MVNKGEADHYISGHWTIDYSELAYENGVKLNEKEKQRIVDYIIKSLRKCYKVDNYEGRQTLIVYPRNQNDTVNKNKCAAEFGTSDNTRRKGFRSNWIQRTDIKTLLKMFRK